MLKIYKSGQEFLLDNKDILDNKPIETSFFRFNAHKINTFERYNYCFKLYDEESYLLVLKMEPYNLLLFGDEKFLKECSDVICDYNLHFTGVLASLNLIEGFYKHHVNRRGGEYFFRHKMDLMYLDELLVKPNLNISKPTENDIDDLVTFISIFHKEALDSSFPDHVIKKTLIEELDSYYILRVDGQIVSIAKIARKEDKICSISNVFTPKYHRNKGYCQQVVSYIGQELLSEGLMPYLYVDKDNPISNHVYTKIGFKYGESKYDVGYRRGNIYTLMLAGGCFWCMAEPYYSIEGVTKVISGYAGGIEVNPTYEDVKDIKTGHRETILIEFDATKISSKKLLDVYFSSIDPFDDSGQYIDKGFNYTCAIFTDNENVMDYLFSYRYDMEKKFNKKVFISLLPDSVLFKAEEYHQDYALKNPKEMEEELIKSGRK